MTRPGCLIVDTDIDHARLIARLAKRKGFSTDIRIIPAADGAKDREEFIASLAPDTSDIVFLHTALGLTTFGRLRNSALTRAEIFAMSDDDSPGLAESCIRMGATCFFRKPFSESSLGPILDDIVVEQQAPSDRDRAPGPEHRLDQFGLMRGSSLAMRELFQILRKVGPADTGVLIVGESGTGKELVAETLHALSARADKTYVTLNCAALSESLIESELFGHERGSFSGAHKRHRGFFESADGGTLFLDEITEMQIDLQSRLLRALESGEVRRIGAVESRRVDVRVIAATNRDPMQAVSEGILREDLYYRLARFLVPVPPLRHRGSDVRGLATYFLRQLNERHGTSLAISESALDTLQRYHWPGNVRQLRHAVERAYIVSEGAIDSGAFDLDPCIVPPKAESEDSIVLRVGMTIAECEQAIIMANLDHNGGNKKETAAVLGVSLKTLYNRLREYGSREGRVTTTPGDPDVEALEV